MPNVQWTPIEHYHITLRFIGDVTSRADMAEIDFWLSQLSWSPFDLALHGVGLREGTTLDSLIVNVERTDALSALHTQIERALRRAGCGPLRNRRFQPCVAIGTLSPLRRAGAAAWVQVHNLFRSPPMSVQHVTLFESIRGSEQPVYRPQADYAWCPDLSLVPQDEA